MNTNCGPAILRRLFESSLVDLSPEAVHSILKLNFPKEDHERVAELSTRASEGNLNPDEREELDEYLRVADLLAILQSTARRSHRSTSLLS